MVLSRALRLSVFSLGLGALHVVAGLGALNLVGCDPEAPVRRVAALASRIELAAGNVSVQQTGGSWERAIAGLLLRRGARVKVGPGDRALIRLDDGSAVFLRHGTEVELHPEGLRLASGEIWIDAPAREDSDPVRYQAGDVVVTATRAGLDIHKRAAGVQVYVARGLAVVTAPGGRTEVQAGQRVDVRRGGPLRLRPVAFWEDWTGGMADRQLAAGRGGAGSGRIYAIDRARPGAPARALAIRAQHVRAVIRGGVARTTVDQRFYNPGDRRVEGYYWFTVPEGAAVDRFALEVGGALIDGEVVERKQAAATYERAIRTPASDPALLEWIDGRTFRARIYPIEAHGTRRVVLSYMQLLPTVDGQQHYVYPLGSAASRHEAARIDEFGLEVDLGEAGEKLKLATTAEARVTRGGRRVTMRRSGYTPQGDFLLELQRAGVRPLQAIRVESARNEAAYVMLRYTPDLDWSRVKKVPGDVVVVVDTSAGGDDTDRQLRAEVAEAILRALSTGDRFALVTADLTPRVIYPVKGSGLAPADEASVGAALDRLARVPRGGATDLGAVLNVALKRLHGASQPAVVYIGDGQATVGELGGEQLARRITRSMVGSPARLFAIGVGAGADHDLLQRLSRLGGGRAFRVDQAEQAVQEALRFVGSHKTPTITDLKLDVGAGLDQLFTSARAKVSQGQEVILLGRTHHPLPASVKVTGKLAGQPFARTYEVNVEEGEQHAYVPKLWARRYLAHQLGLDRQKSRGAIINLGLHYALMTPYTSFLVLDSEAAYQRNGIKRKPRDKLWGTAPRAALELAALPLALFGCSKKRVMFNKSVESRKGDESPDWLKKGEVRQGERGQLHGGEEGKMGSRRARVVRRTGTHGLRGPASRPDRFKLKQLAEGSARSSGVLGTLRPARGSQLRPLFGQDTALGGGSEDPLGGLIGNQPGHGAGRGRALATPGSIRGGAAGAPQVRGGRADVRGAMDREVVRRIIRRHINEVKYCYQKELQSSPSLEGRMQLGLVIAATGQVIRARVMQSSLGNKRVGSCVSQAARRWLFPRPRGGKVVGVSYPFVFTSAGGGAARAANKQITKNKPMTAKRPAPARREAKKEQAPTLRVCSDAARRPLWHRRAIWLQRLERTRGVEGWTRVFRGAWTRCELPSWRDRRLLLDLVQQRVSSAAEVQVLLAALPGRRARAFVRRRLLRRAVTRELARAAGQADQDLDWSMAEASLARLPSAAKRVELLRWLCDKHSRSPGCVLRLVRALIAAKQTEEALDLALRSRRAALVTPDLMEQLGDLLVASNRAALAIRVYSEIVEYAPEDAAARRRLGDIYLRHGWYEPAYRQYRTLAALLPDEPLATLRLAAAAAGTGRVDEALRLERRVAAGEGEPGPTDPRRWARMLSAARIARLLLKQRQGKSETLRQSLRRSLSRLQVLPTSSRALVLMTWEDLDAPLGVGTGTERWQQQVDGRAAGLVALTASAGGGELVLPVRRTGAGDESRAVSFQVTTIRFEGKAVRIANQRGKLSRGEAKVTVTLPAPARRAERGGPGPCTGPWPCW